MKEEAMNSSSQYGRHESADLVARGLGWFSIGLGLAEMIAPRSFTRTLGMDGHEGLVQAYGAREIATGVAILSSAQVAPWVWGRVGGDALDIATLATGLDENNPKRGNVGIALAAVAGVTALDYWCASALSKGNSGPPRGRILIRDYRDRTGFPGGERAARGAARDYRGPKDFRVPELMRPYTRRTQQAEHAA